MAATDLNQPAARHRRIGPVGTAARIIVGLLLLGSVVHGHLAFWALGLLGFPAMLLAWQWRRARTSARLEATGPLGDALNLVVFLGLYLPEFTSDAALLFYAASMLVAALRGDAGCEVLAVPNWLLRRDYQTGGAVFWPIDHLERCEFPGIVRQPGVRVAGARLTADSGAQ